MSNAKVGLDCAKIKSFIFVSNKDSPIPQVFNTLDTITCLKPNFLCKNGFKLRSNISFISLGGPGKLIKYLPLFSKTTPEAMPL